MNIKQHENQIMSKTKQHSYFTHKTQTENSSGLKGKDLMKFIGNVKDVMKQGDPQSQEFVYQQQRMQEQEQIDDQDIEFYHEYFPADMIDTNYELKLIEQYAKGQSFSNYNAENNYCLTNNTSNINSHNLPQTPTTPQGQVPTFQSSHSQEQVIKHHMEFLEQQRNKLSLSQSQKYFNQKFDDGINQQQQPLSVNNQYLNENDNEKLAMYIQNSNSQLLNLMRNQSSLEASRNPLGSAKNTRKIYSGMSANNIFNGNNDVSYLSDYQNHQIIQENNMNDSLKIEDEIQPIPIDGDMKYEEQSYLDSYLLYKNSISQLNCAEDINLQDNQQQQGSTIFYNKNNNNNIDEDLLHNNSQSIIDYSKFNEGQSQKYFLNQTNFLQNMEEDFGTQEPQLPSAILPHFVNSHINYEDTASNLKFNDENAYLEEKYIQEMMFMKRPNSANYLHENMVQTQNKVCPQTLKGVEKRKTFIEQSKPIMQQPVSRGKERSITHNTSFEHKLKILNKQMQQNQYKHSQLKTAPQRTQLKGEKENRMINKENNMSCVQLNPSFVRDKSMDIEKEDNNATKIGKFISKRYINKENKKPPSQNQQISHKAAEATLRANEDYLNQKTKNYLEILKKHLRTDQINTSTINKGQKQPLTGYLSSNQQTGAGTNLIKPPNKLNPTNNTVNKNSSPTKRLSNIYKTTRNTIIPTYSTNDPTQNVVTNNVVTPTLRQNHSFVVANHQKDEHKEIIEAKPENIKSLIPNQLTQQKIEKPISYNLNMKNIALQRYNKTINNTMQNTLRTNRATKDEVNVKNLTFQQAQPTTLTTAPLNTTQAQVKKNPITSNTIKAMQPYIPTSMNAQKSTSAAALSLFDDISLNNFKFEQEIGKGSYATVKLAIDRTSQIRYALKIYPRFVLLDPHKLRNVKREIQILRKMQHPYIIKMPFAIEDKQNQIIVGMEYVGKSSLHSFLKTKPERRLEEVEVKRLFRQIVEGMHYCHKMSVVHRDIKLENILLDQSNNIKIIDFGFSIINSEDKKLKIFCGTPSYMAPEIVSKIEYVGQKADIWALGILLYVMLQGKFPFKGVNDNELFKKIKKGCFSYTHSVTAEAEKLISCLLNLRPYERPSLSTILEHNWFASN